MEAGRKQKLGSMTFYILAGLGQELLQATFYPSFIFVDKSSENLNNQAEILKQSL